MERMKYFNFIEERLSTLATRASIRSSLNLIDLNIHSENFFASLLNLLFDLELNNVNTDKHNIESIDLIDIKNKIVVQVSTTATKQKIEKTLSKPILKDYTDFSLWFIFIGNKDCGTLMKGKYKNPYEISFKPQENIFYLKKMLSIIQNLSIEKIKEIYDLVKKEIGFTPDIVKYDTDLAKVINALSKDNFQNEEFPNKLDFEIEEKIKFNLLDTKREFIKDYSIYIGKLQEKYTEFDRAGKNTSFAVLNSLRTVYRELKNKKIEPSGLFDEIIEQAKRKARESSNIKDVSEEMLELCIQIIVVDAFMKCKIFENPRNYEFGNSGDSIYVATR